MILDGYVEQHMPFICPECNTWMEVKHIIGFGNYPVGGYRNSLKPNMNEAVGFECPKCFTKSVCHSDSSMRNMYECYQKIKEFENKKRRNSV